MAWGAVGIDFKSKFVFPQGKIEHKSYDFDLKSMPTTDILKDEALTFHGNYTGWSEIY